jgi:hypothetical protein
MKAVRELTHNLCISSVLSEEQTEEVTLGIRSARRNGK